MDRLQHLTEKHLRAFQQAQENPSSTNLNILSNISNEIGREQMSIKIMEAIEDWRKSIPDLTQRIKDLL